MERPIQQYFSEVTDPRIKGKCKFLLSDILLIGLCTYLSNGEDYEDMALFAKYKSHLLSDALAMYSSGIPAKTPSHDTFNRVFQLIDSQTLQACLVAHGQDLLDLLSEKQIAIDGKKLRGENPTSRGNQGLYIVNAWVSENSLCIGQAKVQSKSNEITAIPQVLREIDLTEAVVSIDAMGTQTSIAKQIKQQGGHYLLAVKANQKVLYEELECAFKANKATEVTTEDRNHGRIELRKCSILSAKDTIDEEVLGQWDGLQTLVKIEATRTLKNKTTVETRYYISDESVSKALYYSKLVRGHWSIENNLHWHLDVTFKEDSCRARSGNAPENLSTLRKLALQIINHHDDKLSLKKRRVKAAYDADYLKSLIKI
jgi:predicted transposase YbfD/YdcC